MRQSAARRKELDQLPLLLKRLRTRGKERPEDLSVGRLALIASGKRSRSDWTITMLVLGRRLGSLLSYTPSGSILYRIMSMTDDQNDLLLCDKADESEGRRSRADIGDRWSELKTAHELSIATSRRTREQLVA